METSTALLTLCAENSRSPVISPHKCQWGRALMFSLICAWINSWVNNGGAGDLRPSSPLWRYCNAVKWIITASSKALLLFMYIKIYTDCWDKTILPSFCLNDISYTYQAPYLHSHDDVIKWKHFHVTGPLCGEFTGHRWIPLTKTSDAELWCFLWSAPWVNSWINTREAGDCNETPYASLC